jgi:hypothetical protein
VVHLFFAGLESPLKGVSLFTKPSEGLENWCELAISWYTHEFSLGISSATLDKIETRNQCGEITQCSDFSCGRAQLISDLIWVLMHD